MFFTLSGRLVAHLCADGIVFVKKRCWQTLFIETVLSLEQRQIERCVCPRGIKGKPTAHR